MAFSHVVFFIFAGVGCFLLAKEQMVLMRICIA